MLPAVLFGGHQQLACLRKVVGKEPGFIDEGAGLFVIDGAGLRRFRVDLHNAKTLVAAFDAFEGEIAVIVIAPVQFGRAEEVDQGRVYLQRSFIPGAEDEHLIGGKGVTGLFIGMHL